MGKKYNKKLAAKGSTELHQKVVKIALLKMTTDHSRVWSNNTGVGRSMDGERVVRFGLKGSSDVIGIYRGLFLAIEVKTGGAVQRKEQKNFQFMIEKMGGIYVVCRENNVDNIYSIINAKYEQLIKGDKDD